MSDRPLGEIDVIEAWIKGVITGPLTVGVGWGLWWLTAVWGVK